MRALHVVGINLQLGKGFDVRLVGQQEVVVFLIGLGCPGSRFHHHPPVETGPRTAAGDAPEGLAGGTTRHPVMHQDADIDLFVGGAHIQAGYLQRSALAHEVHRHVNLA